MSLGKRKHEARAVEDTGAPQSKKPRKKPVTAKALGITQDEFVSIKAAPLKKKLKAHSKTLGQQVDDDWHDGYEEQGETIEEWTKELKAPLEAVVNIGIERKLAFQQCHDILRTIVESFRDLCANPMRGGVEDSLPDEFSVASEEGDPVTVWCAIWFKLLEAAVGKVEETLLFRFIKDASDGGVSMSEIEDGSPLKPFIDRKTEWEDLPNTLRTFRTRRAIDRRFDGSPDRRTR